MPVKWWRPTTRGRWRWTFPVGTYFGEVLYQKGPDQKWYVFEIRTRKRYPHGWKVDLFRPFKTAERLASAIISHRPNWQIDSNLVAVVNHLRNKNTLVPHQLVSQAFGKIFPTVNGALDPIEIHHRLFVVPHRIRRTDHRHDFKIKDCRNGFF